MKTNDTIHITSTDRAIAYLASRGALHKLSKPLPVIGRDVDVTFAVMHGILRRATR